MYPPPASDVFIIPAPGMRAPKTSRCPKRRRRGRENNAACTVPCTNLSREKGGKEKNKRPASIHARVVQRGVYRQDVAHATLLSKNHPEQNCAQFLRRQLLGCARRRAGKKRSHKTEALLRTPAALYAQALQKKSKPRSSQMRLGATFAVLLYTKKAADEPDRFHFDGPSRGPTTNRHGSKPSTPASTLSPTRSGPTPEGVPVNKTSPASSVKSYIHRQQYIASKQDARRHGRRGASTGEGTAKL